MRKLNFNNLVIENVKEFKYLGVHLYFLEQVLFVNKKKKTNSINMLMMLCTKLFKKSDYLNYQLTVGLIFLIKL